MLCRLCLHTVGLEFPHEAGTRINNCFEEIMGRTDPLDGSEVRAKITSLGTDRMTARTNSLSKKKYTPMLQDPFADLGLQILDTFEPSGTYLSKFCHKLVYRRLYLSRVFFKEFLQALFGKAIQPG